MPPLMVFTQKYGEDGSELIRYGSSPQDDVLLVAKQGFACRNAKRCLWENGRMSIFDSRPVLHAFKDK
jgi:hypothetical protein